MARWKQLWIKDTLQKLTSLKEQSDDHHWSRHFQDQAEPESEAALSFDPGKPDIAEMAEQNTGNVLADLLLIRGLCYELWVYWLLSPSRPASILSQF